MIIINRLINVHGRPWLKHDHIPSGPCDGKRYQARPPLQKMTSPDV